MHLLGEGGQAWVRFILVKRAFTNFFFKYQQESVECLILFLLSEFKFMYRNVFLVLLFIMFRVFYFVWRKSHVAQASLELSLCVKRRSNDF